MLKSVNNWLQKCIFYGKFCRKFLREILREISKYASHPQEVLQEMLWEMWENIHSWSQFLTDFHIWPTKLKLRNSSTRFFHFHAVFGKNLKNNSTFGSWRTPLGKILDPPLNTVSTHFNCAKLSRPDETPSCSKNYEHAFYVNIYSAMFSMVSSLLNVWVAPYETRIHSSKMHTARLLPVSPSMHCSGGWGVPGPRGVCLVPGGVPGPGQCAWSRGGVCLVPGGTCPGTAPPVNRITDRCKNITLPQIRLRAENVADKNLHQMPLSYGGWNIVLQNRHCVSFSPGVVLD